MNKLQLIKDDPRYDYRPSVTRMPPGATGVCRIRFYQDAARGRTAVIAQDRPGVTEGLGVDGYAEDVAWQAFTELGRPLDFTFIHYQPPSHLYPFCGGRLKCQAASHQARFERVQFDFGEFGRFQNPDWHKLPRREVEELIGQPVSEQAKLLVDNQNYSFAGDAYCRLSVYGNWQGLIVAIATQRDDNPGLSITNAAEQLAHQVVTSLHDLGVSSGDFLMVEHYPPFDNDGDFDNYSLVSYQLDRTGRPCKPSWQFLGRAAVQQLIGMPLAE